MKKSCMLKLKPVQPRRKKRISSSEIMKLIDPVVSIHNCFMSKQCMQKSVESSSQAAERDLFSPTDRKRNTKVFSPQTDEKDKRVLLLSFDYNSQAQTDRDGNISHLHIFSYVVSCPKGYQLRNGELRSYGPRYSILLINLVNNESERPIQLTNEGNFIERVSKHHR